MSRKPIFMADQLRNQPYQFQAGRQADTRTNAMKKTEHQLLSVQHNPPFSGFSTATQSQEMNNSFFSQKFDEGSQQYQQILTIVNQMMNEKLQQQELRWKELQNQIDSNRSLIFDLRAAQPQSSDQLNKIIFQFDESLKQKIQKAQEELFKQQQGFQIDYTQKIKELNEQTEIKIKQVYNQGLQNLAKLKEELQQKQVQLSEDKLIKDIQQKIKDLQLVFDSINNEIQMNEQKSKQTMKKLQDSQNELTQRIQVQEECTVAQFKTVQTTQQTTISQLSKKIQDDIENRVQQLQKQIVNSNASSPLTQNEITIQQSELQKITSGVLELQNALKLQSSLYQELSSKMDSYYNQSVKLESLFKSLTSQVDQNKDDEDNQIIQVKLELSSLNKQLERLTQETKNQYEYIQDQTQKQNEEIRKSYQDMLFSFKQSEQNTWMNQVTQAQVQVFNYEEDSESKSDQQISEQNNHEIIETDFGKEDLIEKLKLLSPSKGNIVQEEKIIVEQSKPIEQIKEISEKPQEQNSEQKQIDREEDDEEVTYQLDDQGFLLDEEGNYILDENGQMIQLNENQIEYLRKQEMVVEEEN